MPIKKATPTTPKPVPEPKLVWEVGQEPIRMAVFENYRAVIQTTPRKSFRWTITRLTVGSGKDKIEAQWAGRYECSSISKAKAEVLVSLKKDMKRPRPQD